MKKNYFLLAFFALTMISANAQFGPDDLESWTDGSPVFGGHWTSWSETITDAGLASSNQAHSGDLSYYVDGLGVIDGLLDLGNKIFGNWYLSFWAYVPSGKSGYYNVQANVPVIPSWCGEIYFNRDNTNPGGGEVVGFNPFIFTFPHDKWFYVDMYWDITFGVPLATWTMNVDGVQVVPPGTNFVDSSGSTPTSLGGINFFSTHSSNELYLDDFNYDFEPIPLPITEDDMESYTVDQPINEGWWTDAGCGGGVGCSLMSSSDYANSGNQSGYIPGDGTTDAVLDLGNKIFGRWGVSLQMYVPSGEEANFSIIGAVPVGGSEDIGDFVLNEDNGSPGMGTLDNIMNGPLNFNFPHDEWFQVLMNIDFYGLSGPTWEVYIAGTEILPEGTLFLNEAGNQPTSLGGIEFFSESANSRYYLDDVDFCKYGCSLLSNNAVTKTARFIAYPNPTSDILTLDAEEEITSVTIFNILGQQMFSSEINAFTAQIDISKFDTGIYFVKAVIANSEGTIKIIVD